MGDVIQFSRKPKIKVDNYFGGCPHCGGADEYLNIASDHWFVCDTHRTKWLAGSNLFSCWRNETEDIWRLNRYRLANYQNVWPLPPTDEVAP